MDRKDTFIDEALPCPFCKAQPHCSHGYSRCPKCIEESHGDPEWECDHDFTGQPTCRLFCPTEDCPAHFIEGLWGYSNIYAVKEGSWAKAFKEACDFWNKYLRPVALVNS